MQNENALLIHGAADLRSYMAAISYLRLGLLWLVLDRFRRALTLQAFEAEQQVHSAISEVTVAAIRSQRVRFPRHMKLAVIAIVGRMNAI